jgi:ribonuclease VapC
MVIDSSALVAIALVEPSRQPLLDRLGAGERLVISSVSILEASMVLRARKGPRGLSVLYEFVDSIKAEVVPFDQIQARLAIGAFERFGKGMGHRAQLNFGDCAVYALAQSRAEPILATGRDFAATDIALVSF